MDESHKTASTKSYAKHNFSVKNQKHWFGNCNVGSTSDKNCCSNAFPLSGTFDWTKFSKGNSCAGDSDTDIMIDEIYCYFDYEKYLKESQPKPVSIFVFARAWW